MQPGIGLSDPGQSGVLMFGEVFGVLPQRISGVLEAADPLVARPIPLAGRDAVRPFAFGAGQHPRVVPGPAPFVIQCPGGPADHVKRVGTADRLGAARGDHVDDPAGGIGRDVGDLSTPIRSQRVEEPVQGRVVAAGRGPDQPAAVVVDHDRDVVVSALIGDLVDADTPQIGKPINRLISISPHPRDDRPHGAPGDPHQLTHRGFRTRHGQPGHSVIEGIGMSGMMARPRHRDHRRPISGAVDPRGVGLQHHLHRAPIQGPPAAPTFTTVIVFGKRRLGPAAPTPTRHRASRPHPGHHQLGAARALLVEPDALDYSAAVDTQQITP